MKTFKITKAPAGYGEDHTTPYILSEDQLIRLAYRLLEGYILGSVATVPNIYEAIEIFKSIGYELEEII